MVYVPEATQVDLTITFSEKNITKIVAVPSYLPSGYTQWYTWMSLSNLKYNTTIMTIDLKTEGVLKSIFTNRSGINSQEIGEVYVNINGSLLAANKVFCNINDTLIQILNITAGL